MIKLLKAEFTRCFTGKVFWLIALFTLVTASSFNFIKYITVKREHQTEVFNDSMLYIGLISIGMIAAIFVAFHAGGEFDEGTVRNKLIAGNTKTGIYLCHLAVSSVAMVIIQSGTSGRSRRRAAQDDRDRKHFIIHSLL